MLDVSYSIHCTSRLSCKYMSIVYHTVSLEASGYKFDWKSRKDESSVPETLVNSINKYYENIGNIVLS